MNKIVEPNSLFNGAIVSGALVIIALMFMTLAATVSAEQAPSNASTLPTKAYTDWQMWTDGRQSEFDVGRCEDNSWSLANAGSGDVNGDGKMDLICVYDYGNDQTRTFVQLSTGSSYTKWQNWTGNLISQFNVNLCTDISIGDVNGDGFSDLICPYNYGGDETRTFVQLSSGSSFTTWQRWSGDRQTQFDLGRCWHLFEGDFNGDGFSDLICPYNYGNNQTRTFVQLSTGNSFGNFQNWTGDLQSGFNLDWCSIRTGDVNGDGKTDLICAYDYGNAQTRTFVQLSTGSDFGNWQNWTGDIQNQFERTRCYSFFAGDVNNDNKTDLICIYNYSGNLTRTFVQLSSGTGFTNWQGWADRQSQFDIDKCDVQIGDVNGDGNADLICAYDYDNAQTRTFVQLSSGSEYTQWQNWTGDLQNQFDLGRCDSIVAGDVTGNGVTDLACVYDYDANLTATFVQQAELYQVFLPALTK